MKPTSVKIINKGLVTLISLSLVVGCTQTRSYSRESESTSSSYTTTQNSNTKQTSKSNKSGGSSTNAALGAAAVGAGFLLGAKLLFGGSSSSSSSSTSSNYSPSSNSSTSGLNSSKRDKKMASYVTSVTNDGKITIVKCSAGEDIKIYRDSSGKCTDNYQFGSYGCSSVIKWARERCERR